MASLAAIDRRVCFHKRPLTVLDEYSYVDRAIEKREENGGGDNLERETGNADYHLLSGETCF